MLLCEYSKYISNSSQIIIKIETEYYSEELILILLLEREGLIGNDVITFYILTEQINEKLQNDDKRVK